MTFLLLTGVVALLGCSGQPPMSHEISLVNSAGKKVAQGTLDLPDDWTVAEEFEGRFAITSVEEQHPESSKLEYLDGRSRVYRARSDNRGIWIDLAPGSADMNVFIWIPSHDLKNMTFSNDLIEGDVEPYWAGRVEIRARREAG